MTIYNNKLPENEKSDDNISTPNSQRSNCSDDISLLQTTSLDYAPHLFVQDLDDEALVPAVSEVQTRVKHLQTENLVFYEFLKANDPLAIEAMENSMKVAQINRERMSVSTRRSSLVAKLPKRFSVISSETTGSFMLSGDREAYTVSLSQKMELVMKIMEDLQSKQENFTKKMHGIKANLVAKLEEFQTRTAELEETLVGFEKFRQAHKHFSLDNWVRFMEEWSKKTMLTVDKIRLRYSSLRGQHQKLAAILAHKQLIGENVQEIDFEQLRIENLRLVEKIEAQSNRLLELRRITGAGNLKLSQHKKVLQEKVLEKEKIEAKIKNYEKEIMKSDEDLEKLTKEVAKVNQKYEKMGNKVSNHTAPDVMDYIRKKMELDDLKRDLKIWKRRESIKDMALATAVRQMKKSFKNKKPHPPSFQ